MSETPQFLPENETTTLTEQRHESIIARKIIDIASRRNPHNTSVDMAIDVGGMKSVYTAEDETRMQERREMESEFEEDRLGEIAQILSTSEDLNEVAQELAEEKRGDLVIKFLNDHEDLDWDSIGEAIATNNPRLFIENRELFRGVDTTNLGNELLRLAAARGLDANVAWHLMVENLKIFPDIDGNQLVQACPGPLNIYNLRTIINNAKIDAKQLEKDLSARGSISLMLDLIDLFPDVDINAMISDNPRAFQGRLGQFADIIDSTTLLEVLKAQIDEAAKSSSYGNFGSDISPEQRVSETIGQYKDSLSKDQLVELHKSLQAAREQRAKLIQMNNRKVN